MIVERAAGCQVVAEFPGYVQRHFAREYVRRFLSGVGWFEKGKRPALTGICKGLAYMSENTCYAEGSITALPWGGFIFPLKGSGRWLTALLPLEEVRLERGRLRLVLHVAMLLSLLVAISLLFF